MPSTDQIVAHLKWIMKQDVLNPYNTGLSPDGKKLIELIRSLLNDFVLLLKEKNGKNELQEILWSLSHVEKVGDVSLHINALEGFNAAQGRNAGLESLKTIFNLFMQNSEFRQLFHDANLILHQILADTAGSVAETASSAQERLEPDTALPNVRNLEEASRTQETLTDPTEEVADIVGDGIKKAAQTVEGSVRENVIESDQTKNLIRERIHRAVKSLKAGSQDYEKSVSVLSQVLKTYINTYAQTLEEAVDADVGVTLDPSLKLAGEKIWELVQNFGSKKEWEEVRHHWDVLIRKLYKGAGAKQGKKADTLTNQVAERTGNWMDGIVDLLEKLLTDPEYLVSEEPENKFNEKINELSSTEEFSTVKEEVQETGKHLARLLQSIIEDKSTTRIFHRVQEISAIIVDQKSDALWINPRIKADIFNTIIPSIVSLIYFIPIPRLELTAPDAAVLLSSVILEPGAPPTTGSFSSNPATTPSFFPERLRMQTYTDLDIVRRSPRPLPPHKVTFTLEQLTFRADSFGYRLLLNPNKLYNPHAYNRGSRGMYETQGLASVAIEKRGMDIAITLDITTHSLANIVSLDSVDVTIHNLSWSLLPTPFKKRARSNKWINALLFPIAFFWKIIKYILILPILYVIIKPLIITPMIKLFLRRAIENQIKDQIRSVNRELLFARERMRAVKVADVKSWKKWFDAVKARWTEGGSETTVGVAGSSKYWWGIRAVGGVDYIWEDQGLAAGNRVDEARHERGWKNEIFNVIE